MTTTITAYGFDSYPYLHVARRRCLPYEFVLEVVSLLEAGETTPAMDPLDLAAIIAAYSAEQRRRMNGGGQQTRSA